MIVTLPSEAALLLWRSCLQTKGDARISLVFTLNVSEDNGEAVFVSSDGYMMAIYSSYKSIHDPAPGTYIMSKPVKSKQKGMLDITVEPAPEHVKFPNWRRLVPDMETLTHVGKTCAVADNALGIQCVIPCAFNIEHLAALPLLEFKIYREIVERQHTRPWLFVRERFLGGNRVGTLKYLCTSTNFNMAGMPTP